MSTITVTKRSGLGKSANKKLRREGIIPGIIYGDKKDVVPIQLSAESFQKHFSHREKIAKLEYEGITEDVILREVQYDTFGEEIYHIDFVRIDLSKKVEVVLDLNFIGNPKGIQVGGIWDKYIKRIKVKCYPNEIPESVPVYVEKLEIGDRIKVKELKLPESAETELEEEIVITAIRAPKGAKKEEEETEEAKS